MVKVFSLVFAFCLMVNLFNVNNLFAGNRLSEIIGNNFVPNEILVKFNDYVNEEECIGIHKSFGIKSFKESYKKLYHVVSVGDGNVKKMIKRYRRNSAVKFAEPNYYMKAYLAPNDELFEFQWHLSQINCEEAWDIATGEGITVAVIDTGVNPNGFDGFDGRVIQGKDFVNGDNDSSDDNGHGTHVAGTIGQATNNSIGVAGVAFNSTIMSIKVLGRFGRGNTNSIIDGINWAADNGAQIINLSLGGPAGSSILEETINDLHSRGIVIIAAAGNSSGPVGFPAAYEPVIAVGSVRFDEELSSFSNFGPEIDVVAPGGDTTEDQNNDDMPDGVLQETFRKGFFRNRNKFFWNYTPFQGTSQASPHVAGVAAMLLEKDPTMTPDEVRTAMTSTAKDLGDPGKDDKFGWGLLDAAAALSPTPTPSPTPSPEASPTPETTPTP